MDKFISIIKHKHFILGIIITLVLVCAVMILNGHVWLEGVHRNHIDTFQTPLTSCDKLYTIKGNTPLNLLDIRYPDSDDFLTFTFNSNVSELKLTSLITGQVYTSTNKDNDKLTHEIYGPEPGEYEILIKYDCQPSGVDRARIIINPVFNFAGRENTYYRLPITGWTPSANMEILVGNIDQTPYNSSELTLNMQQFNMVQLKVQLPKLAEYINKLTEIGFRSSAAKKEYISRITHIESYIPVSIEGTLEIIGLNDGSPIPKSNLPNPRLIFPQIGCTNSKMCCIASGLCTVTIRNVRTNHVYKLTMYVKYQRPGSIGYRTTLYRELRITVTDPTNSNDLTTGVSNKLNDYTNMISRNADLQLKFEREQQRQDMKLDVLEDQQNNIFDKVASI